MRYEKTHKDSSKIIAVGGNVNISSDVSQRSQSQPVGTSIFSRSSATQPFPARTFYSSMTLSWAPTDIVSCKNTILIFNKCIVYVYISILLKENSNRHEKIPTKSQNFFFWFPETQIFYFKLGFKASKSTSLIKLFCFIPPI